MIAPLLFAVTLLGQAVTVPPQRAPLTENRAPVPVAPPPGAPMAPAMRVDRLFATAANDSSNAEIAFAKLALARSHTDEVKSYARSMISEHEGLMAALLPRLTSVMGKTPPHELSAPDALTYYRLQHVPDVAFDQTYVLTQVAGHLVTLGAFQTESEDGADAALKKTVKQWTPTIQSHLELAVDITRHVGGENPLKSGAE